MWYTLLLLYLAGIGADYLSMKALMKQKRNMDADEFHLLVIVMFVPFVNFIASFITFAIILGTYLVDYTEKKKRERKKKKNKGFIEILFGLKRTDGYFREKYTYEEKKKKRELS
jgi:hypothetical protein